MRRQMTGESTPDRITGNWSALNTHRRGIAWTWRALTIERRSTANLVQLCTGQYKNWGRHRRKPQCPRSYCLSTSLPGHSPVMAFQSLFTLVALAAAVVAVPAPQDAQVNCGGGRFVKNAAVSISLDSPSCEVLITMA